MVCEREGEREGRFLFEREYVFRGENIKKEFGVFLGRLRQVLFGIFRNSLSTKALLPNLHNFSSMTNMKSKKYRFSPKREGGEKKEKKKKGVEKVS